MLASQVMHTSFAARQSTAGLSSPQASAQVGRPGLINSALTGRNPSIAPNLRNATRTAALPEISDAMLIQSAAVGHAIKTLAFCGFSMLGINASTELLAKRTGNEAINTVATSIAAIAIGAVIRNELTDMQAVFDNTKPPESSTRTAQTDTRDMPNALPVSDFPEKAILH